MSIVTKKDEVPIDVTWEDQQRICIFSRLHNRVLHLQKLHKLLNDDIEKVDDASSEAMICDKVKYVFGEAFVDLDTDRVNDLLEKEKERLEAERGEIDKELAELQGAKSELKALLYAKFGSQIYLEDK